MITIEKQLKIKLIGLINLLNANNLAKIKLYSHEIKNEKGYSSLAGIKKIY